MLKLDPATLPALRPPLLRNEARRRSPNGASEALFGNHDENLRFLEEQLKVRIKTQGSELFVEGDERRRRRSSGQIFDQLGALMKDGYSVSRRRRAPGRAAPEPGPRARACATT